MTFLESILTQFFAPAEQASIPLLVPKEQLLAANSLYQATSMGAVLLASGAPSERQALPHARIMIHQMMGGFSGQAEDIDIQAREIIRMTDVLNDVLARHTGHKIKKIAQDTQRDYYFSSQEAKEYGIIDEVMQNRKLKAL